MAEVGIVAQALPAISAAVGAYGALVLQRLENTAADGTVRLGQRLLTRILRHDQDGRVERAVLGLANAPASETRSAGEALGLVLGRLLEADPALRRELTAMLSSGPATASEGSIAAGRDLRGIASTGANAINIQAEVAHVHSGESAADTADPVICTVELQPGAMRADLVVDADPPRAMTPSAMLFVVTVEARATRAVVLNAARPVVLSRRFPRPACYEIREGAWLQPRKFLIDLDAEQPRVTARGADFPFTVSAADVEQLQLEPIGRRDEIRWQLELDWTCAGRRGTTVVDNNGEPFEIYPMAALHTAGWGSSFLNSGCGDSYGHDPQCPMQRLEALSPGARRNTWGPLVPRG